MNSEGGMRLVVVAGADNGQLRRVLLHRRVAEAVGAGSTECLDQVAGFVQHAGFAAPFASDRRGAFGLAGDRAECIQHRRAAFISAECAVVAQGPEFLLDLVRRAGPDRSSPTSGR
jgi:hypothetical protein